MKRSIVWAWLMTLTLLFGCVSKQQSEGTTEIINVEPQPFVTAIQDLNISVIDVRTAAEYAEGHLPDALSIDVKEPDFVSKVEAALGDAGEGKKEVAVYCRSGKRSRRAAEMLQEKGYVVYNLVGGYKDIAPLLPEP